MSSGSLNIPKAAIARVLGYNYNKVYARLLTIDRITQKLAFNQIYFENLDLTDEEVEFLCGCRYLFSI